MRPSARFFTVCVGGLITLFLTTTAQAAGLLLYELAMPDMGTASAGRAALAKDASTPAINPAGMTRLDRPRLLAGIQPFIVMSEFDPDVGTTIPGSDGGDAGDAEIDQTRPLGGSLSGDYESNYLHFFNATLIWKL